MFKLSGSTGNWWNTFAKNFRGGGEGRSLLSGLKQGLSKEQNPLLTSGANKLWKNLGGNKLTGEKGKWGFYENLKASAMDKSRKLSPLFEGGLSGTGGSLHQDLLPWMEDLGMKGSHALSGTKYFADKGGGGGSSNTVVSSDSEDPSLINAGNWKIPGEIQDRLRRKQQIVSDTDLTKNQRGRLNVAKVS